MTHRLFKTVGGFALVAVLAIGSAAPAVAAGHHHRSHGENRTASSETALTDPTLSSASAAALVAVPGATVKSATTETDSSITGAAYEVRVINPDGSKALVIEDSSFTVLSTTTIAGHTDGADSGDGHGGQHHGGRHHDGSRR